MSETPKRIRWTGEDGGDMIGEVGTVPRGLFAIWAPRRGDEAWEVTTTLPGKPSLPAECRYGADAEEVKAEAECWLAEFVSSLGAVFPLGPVVSRCACGGLASHQHGCRWRQGYGSLIEVVTDATPAPMAGEETP